MPGKLPGMALLLGSDIRNDFSVVSAFEVQYLSPLPKSTENAVFVTNDSIGRSGLHSRFNGPPTAEDT